MGNYCGIWILGEERNGAIHSATFELLAWGRRLADKAGEKLTCVLLGETAASSGEALIAAGADRVLFAQHPRLGEFRLDPYARIVEQLIREHEPEVLLSAATTMGRTLMPVLAARLETGLTADCTGLDIDPEDRTLLQTRPAIGGNVLATIKTPTHRPQMATVRPKILKPLPADAARSGVSIKINVNEASIATRVTRVAFKPDPLGDTPVEESDVVVAGGKGLRDGKGFDWVNKLASRLRGAVGASRVAVDYGWAPHGCQIGLSGKSVSPKTYIALGISGSPNHLAGMATSEFIIAVNKDPDANIFRAADFGIVGDVHEIVPALLRKLSEKTEGES